MKKLKDYSLSIVLGLLFLASWIGQFFVQIVEFGNEARDHGQQFVFSDFWVSFWRATLENWQSEFLQLLTFVVLTAFLIHRDSHESKDSQDRLERKVDALLLAQGDSPKDFL